MLFTEKKVGDIYQYRNDDFYGSLDIESTVPLEANALDALLKGLASARKGDYRFWKDLHDRIHGTATQKHDHTTKGDKITSVTVDIVKSDTE